MNPGTQFYLDPHRVVARNLEVPSGGGIGTARAIAKAYGAGDRLTTGGAGGVRSLRRRSLIDATPSPMADSPPS